MYQITWNHKCTIIVPGRKRFRQIFDNQFTGFDIVQLDFGYLNWFQYIVKFKTDMLTPSNMLVGSSIGQAIKLVLSWEMGLCLSLSQSLSNIFFKDNLTALFCQRLEPNLHWPQRYWFPQFSNSVHGCIATSDENLSTAFLVFGVPNPVAVCISPHLILFFRFQLQKAIHNSIQLLPCELSRLCFVHKCSLCRCT